MVVPKSPPPRSQSRSRLRLPPPPSLAPGSGTSITLGPSNPLGPFGFKLEHASADKVRGWFQVTPKCCQPFGTLHGGVSALIAEDLGNIGAYLASEGRKITGIDVCSSHLKKARVGDIVHAEATPLNPGTTIQVWEVRFWKIDSTSSGNKSLLASSSVTVLCNMSGNAKDGQNNVKQAKL